MGLIEKRMIADINEKQLPEFKKAMEPFFSSQLEVVINWESFGNFSEAKVSTTKKGDFKNRLFKQILDVIAKVGKDNVGKEALKEGIHQIVFCNLPGSDKPKISLTDKKLTLELPYTDGDLPPDYEIHKAIETKL